MKLKLGLMVLTHVSIVGFFIVACTSSHTGTDRVFHEAATDLQRLIDQNSLSLLEQNCPDKMFYHHHSVGALIRRDFQLWDHSSGLHKWFQNNGVGDPDFMSDVLLTWAVCKSSGGWSDVHELILQKRSSFVPPPPAEDCSALEDVEARSACEDAMLEGFRVD